jgi:hypothetical protein
MPDPSVTPYDDLRSLRRKGKKDNKDKKTPFPGARGKGERVGE